MKRLRKRMSESGSWVKLFKASKWSKCTLGNTVLLNWFNRPEKKRLMWFKRRVSIKHSICAFSSLLQGMEFYVKMKCELVLFSDYDCSLTRKFEFWLLHEKVWDLKMKDTLIERIQELIWSLNFRAKINKLKIKQCLI